MNNAYYWVLHGTHNKYRSWICNWNVYGQKNKFVFNKIIIIHYINHIQ